MRMVAKSEIKMAVQKKTLIKKKKRMNYLNNKKKRMNYLNNKKKKYKKNRQLIKNLYNPKFKYIMSISNIKTR